MKIQVLHLSDIHIRAKGQRNIVLDRLERIGGVAHKHAYDTSVCFIVVSGDIASSGGSEEYSVAIDFFNDLQNIIKGHNDSINIEYIMVPGNHDCDFSAETEVRRTLLTRIPQNARFGKDYSIINACTSVQENFFNFLSRFSHIENFQDLAKIHYVRDFTSESHKIRFNCYNTAWMSQLDEEQGKMVFPIGLIETVDETFDLVLSVFHHTYNWLEEGNCREFRRHIERTSDVIFTGHAHDSGQAVQTRITGEMNEYLEGGTLQEANTNKSEFNVLVVDLDAKRQKVVQYAWRRNIYGEKETSNWFPFIRSKFVQRHEFANNQTFSRCLNDPGASFRHPRKDILNLEDIFVYPDLRVLEGKPGEVAYRPLEGKDLVDYAADNKRMFILGTDRSGKTALAKRIYVDFLSRGMVPILMDGSSIKVGKKEEYLDLVSATFRQQYSDSLAEKYSQLKKSNRVIVIDDFDKVKLNVKGKALLVDTLARFADTIILFSGNFMQLVDTVNQQAGADYLLQFKICNLVELGYFLREKLIKKWLSLGQELRIDREELIYKTSGIARVVNAVLRKSVIPSHPVFMLIILQAMEENKRVNPELGSFGYFYELLITLALARTSPRLTMDTKYTYLTELAYYFFSHNVSRLKDSDMGSLSDEYFRIYLIRIPHEMMMRDLVASQILVKQDGSYTFRYKYIYYYFVARYIRDNIESKENRATIRKHIRQMTKAIFRDDYANILIFLSYLSKNPIIVKEMLRNSRDIYKEYELCNLQEDIEFLRKLAFRVPQVTLGDREVEESREEHLKEKDRIGLIEDAESWPSEGEEEIDDNDPLKMGSSYKTLEVMGQIVRNFAGSLKADVKSSLIEECYRIGLRTLRFFLSIVEDNLDIIKEFISVFGKNVMGIRDDKTLEETTNQVIFQGLEFLCFNVIKTISSCVGSEELEEVYKRVLNKLSSRSVALIDICVKLDHFHDIPVEEIIGYHRQAKRDFFSTTLLRYMVIERLRLFYSDRKIRDRLCSKLEISIKPHEFTGNRLKKFRRK